MKFEWDENKNQENIKKHGVPFEEAASIFLNKVMEEAEKGESIMKDNYSFDNVVIKDYSNEISDIEKLRIILNAFKATAKISKEEIKKGVHFYGYNSNKQTNKQTNKQLL